MGALVEPEPMDILPVLPEHAIESSKRKRRSGRTMHPGEIVWDLARQTLTNLRRNKLRSFLTLFGIAWGISSLVLMSALSDGFRQGQRKSMSQIGDNLVLVWGGTTEEQAGGKRAGRNIQLYDSDVQVVRENCPLVEVVAGEAKTHQVPARSATNSGRFLTVGVSPDYLKLRNLRVEKGRTVSAGDVADNRRVAVLGASVRKQLFEKKPAPLGETIYLNNYPYEVIGVMSEKDQNSSYDGWDNDKVLVPDSALLRDMPSDRGVYAEHRISCLIYRPVSTKQWEEAQHEVRAALGRVKGFAATDKGALSLWDTIEDSQLFDMIFDAGEIFLAVVALITLSLGGVGVMNTMMMAVAERTNEIGLKKALGATSRRILADFFMEGLFLALLSGVAGLVLTILLATLVNMLPMPQMFSGILINFRILLFATAALGTVAVLSALPPARHAAAMTPVEALRHER